MKKSYRILQLQFQLQFYKGTHPSTYNLHVHKYTTSREFSIQNPILHAEGKELFEYYYYIPEGKETFIPEKKFYAYKARRSSRSPSVCSTGHSGHSSRKTFQRHSRHSSLSRNSRHSRPSRDIPDFPVIHDLPAFLGNSTSSVSPGISTHSSILQLEYIFYVFYKFYSLIGFHRKLNQVPVE